MFKGCHFPSSLILQAVRYYVSYKLSYRDIEEIYAERGINSYFEVIKLLFRTRFWNKPARTPCLKFLRA